MATEPYSHRLGFRVARLAPLFTSFAILLAGCGERDAPPDTARQVVGVAEVPAGVLAAARKALPGVKFEDAWKNVDVKSRSLHSYEVRGRDARGKVREVRVSPEGAVLETE